MSLIEVDRARFEKYPSIPRLDKITMTITEKIDGTNASILIENGKIVCVGSRKRAISPDVPAVRDDQGNKIQPKQVNDNFGFAQWVEDNAAGLIAFLGDGRHYGEWAGPGIQKNPLDLERRMLFLFNAQHHPPEKFQAMGDLVPDLRCVPVVYHGPFDRAEIERHRRMVETESFVEDAGTENRTEGIIVSVLGSKIKITHDDRHKGAR